MFPILLQLRFSVRVEETDNALGLLKWLNQSIQQKSVKAAITESDIILMVLAESVHEKPTAWSDTWKPTPSTLTAGTAKPFN
jgi:hypothetical protein